MNGTRSETVFNVGLSLGVGTGTEQRKDEFLVKIFEVILVVVFGVLARKLPSCVVAELSECFV